jgi:asparagine synthase (glutamine-hydrolysing)
MQPTLPNLLQVQNTRVVVSAEKYLAEASKVQYHMDEPLANPSGNLLYFLSQRTAQDLKAVLSGEGADEMFGGYNVYKEPLALAKYQQLPLPLRKTLANAFEFANGFIKNPRHQLCPPRSAQYRGALRWQQQCLQFERSRKIFEVQSFITRTTHLRTTPHPSTIS